MTVTVSTLLISQTPFLDVAHQLDPMIRKFAQLLLFRNFGLSLQISQDPCMPTWFARTLDHDQPECRQISVFGPTDDLFMEYFLERSSVSKMPQDQWHAFSTKHKWCSCLIFLNFTASSCNLQWVFSFIQSSFPSRFKLGLGSCQCRLPPAYVLSQPGHY